MRVIIYATMAMTVICGANPALAASKSAQAIVKRDFPDICSGGGRGLDPAGIIERDLTGDGKKDLIVDIGRADCGGEMNNYCGSGGCGVVIYVNQNGRLVEKLSLLGAGIEVLNGKPPGLKLTGNDGGSTTYRWKGGEFR